MRASECDRVEEENADEPEPGPRRDLLPSEALKADSSRAFSRSLLQTAKMIAAPAAAPTIVPMRPLLLPVSDFVRAGSVRERVIPGIGGSLALLLLLLLVLIAFDVAEARSTAVLYREPARSMEETPDDRTPPLPLSSLLLRAALGLALALLLPAFDCLSAATLG